MVWAEQRSQKIPPHRRQWCLLELPYQVFWNAVLHPSQAATSSSSFQRAA
jgi:hypothetical protein